MPTLSHEFIGAMFSQRHSSASARELCKSAIRVERQRRRYEELNPIDSLVYTDKYGVKRIMRASVA